MPFKEHPEFNPPEQQDAKIWRYMDLAKFISVLDTNSLYFSRLDQLSRLDPFEGYYTDLNLAFENIPFSDMPDEWKESSGINNEEIYASIIEINKHSREMVKNHRSVTFVNSWHIKEHESAAMWKVYLSNNEGIAIQSTYNNFTAALERYEDFEVHVGRINYIDYESEAIPMGNTLSPFIYKRKSFEYEDELRALIWTPQHGKNDLVHPENNKFKDIMGLVVPVNLDTLIDRIYVSPDAPSWIGSIVKSITGKYGLKKEVVQSILSARPLY